MKCPTTISISALSSEPAREHLKKATDALYSLIAELEKRGCKPIFFLGGYKGLMKYLTDILLEKGYQVVHILPLEYENLDRPENIIGVQTGMTFQNRNPIMVRSGEILVCMGGGAGSIMEVITGIALGKKVFLLTGTNMPSDSLENSYPDGKVDERKNGRIFFVSKPEELGKIIMQNLM